VKETVYKVVLLGPSGAGKVRKKTKTIKLTPHIRHPSANGVNLATNYVIFFSFIFSSSFIFDDFTEHVDATVGAVFNSKSISISESTQLRLEV